MRQSKWWRLFFIWALGVASVNANHTYDVLYKEETKKNKPGLPKKWMHVEFWEQLVYDLILPMRKRASILAGTSASESPFASTPTSNVSLLL